MLLTANNQQGYHTTSQETNGTCKKFLVKSSWKELGTIQNSQSVREQQCGPINKEEKGIAGGKTAPQQWQMQQQQQKKKIFSAGHEGWPQGHSRARTSEQNYSPVIIPFIKCFTQR